jgi:glycosyltransferase involved in cell wall biosynthesis
MLAQRNIIVIKVFYTWSQTEAGKKFDPGFGTEVEWDIPLLEGYDYMFSNNISCKPGSNHFKGIDNPNLINEINAWNPNAILVYGWSFKSHLKVLKYFKGKIPVLFRGDSTLLDEQAGFKKIFRRLLLKYIYSKIDVAMYVGVANKKYFKAMGIKNEALVFMPHAVDNKRFENEKLVEHGKNLRSSLGIKDNEIVFLFSGKLDANKNIKQLANIFLKSEINAHLLVVGSGVFMDELTTMCFNRTDKIHLLGFQNQLKIPEIYKAANVFILPSTSETWGLSINEAMAAGLAIIASNSCGAALDLVIENTNGFTFSKNNFVQLEKYILQCLSNKELVKQMGISSKVIIQKYTFDIAINALEETVKKLTA